MGAFSDKRMSRRIAILSKSDESGGGASRVACQLGELITGRCDDLVADNWVGLRKPKKPLLSLHGSILGDLIYRVVRKISRMIGLPDFLSTETLTLLLRRRKPYHLYHIHDISGAISPYTLNLLAKRAPVIWTFHDCSPFTGGCIYPMDCVAYTTHKCANCPQLNRWPLLTRIDRTPYMQAYKLRLINNAIAAVICPTEWIAREARRSGIAHSLITVIPNAVDTSIFSPRNKTALRAELGLPGDADTVLLTTMSFSNPYKGTEFACRVLENIERPLNIIAVGANLESMNLPDRHYYRSFGRTLDREQMAKYYACSDVLLFPSMADNCPLVLLESMACGTPAVAFDSGGISEIIDHGADGWLAPRGDWQALLHGLEFAVDNKTVRTSWAENARKKILAHHNEEAFLQAHLRIYHKLLENS